MSISLYEHKYILLIMLLAITQVIALLATSDFNYLPVVEPVNDGVVTLENIREVNDELKQVNVELIEAINFSYETDSPSEQEIESNTGDNTETESVVIPVVVSPVIEEKKKETVALETMSTKSYEVVDVETTLSDNSEDVVVKEVVVTKIETKLVSVEKSFSYIKYDEKGHSLSDNAEQWACVRDSAEGLTWEVKSNEDDMRNRGNLYSWFNPEENVSRGITDGGRCKGSIDCDTHAYIKAMNQEDFCGHNDWRLPTREEMMGLVSYSKSDDKVTINTSYFPETLPSWYWTASSNGSRPEFAWYILFNNGLSLNDLKENPKHIRLVRSN